MPCSACEWLCAPQKGLTLVSDAGLEWQSRLSASRRALWPERTVEWTLKFYNSLKFEGILEYLVFAYLIKELVKKIIVLVVSYLLFSLSLSFSKSLSFYFLIEPSREKNSVQWAKSNPAISPPTKNKPKKTLSFLLTSLSAVFCECIWEYLDVIVQQRESFPVWPVLVAFVPSLLYATGECHDAGALLFHHHPPKGVASRRQGPLGGDELAPGSGSLNHADFGEKLALWTKNISFMKKVFFTWSQFSL